MSYLEKNLYLKRKGSVRKGTALSIQVSYDIHPLHYMLNTVI